MYPNITHDSEADVDRIRLSDLPYAFGEDWGHDRRVDYANDGQPIGIELLNVSKGIDAERLPLVITTQTQADGWMRVVDSLTDFRYMSESQKEVAKKVAGLLGELLYDWEEEHEEPIHE